MIPQIEAPEQNENPFVLPTFKDAKARRDWFIDNARQQNFDVIASALNAADARDSEGFLKFDLSSNSAQIAHVPLYFYTAADPALLLRLRFLGMVEGCDVVLPEDEGQRAEVNHQQNVHDSEIERTCSLAVFKLRRIFFENEVVKEQYCPDDFIPLETVQAHTEYQKTKKALDQVFSDKKALRQRLMKRFQDRLEKKDFNDDVYFQLAARFLDLDRNVDAVSNKTFKKKILKDKETSESFIQYITEGLYKYYHQRLGRDLKGHLEPRERGKAGIVLKDKSIIEGEVQNFCGTPEENLILAWKMLHAQGECAPQMIQIEKTKIEQEKNRENLISDYLFHLAGIYWESPEYGAACGQGTWIRTLDFFNGKYNEKVLNIVPNIEDLSQITKEGIELHYSSYIAQALKDKRLEPHLGALYFGNIRIPTEVQQALIGKIKEAFAGLYRHHFNELPQDYTLGPQDWIRLDRFLYTPIFTETLQSEILKIANPFLAKETASILSDIQTCKEHYQPAFQELALLVQKQNLSLLHQISGEVSNIFQHLQNNQPKKERVEKCRALLKTLNMPLTSFILPFQLQRQLKILITKTKTIQKKKSKAFQKFLAEMNAADKQLTEQYKMQSGQHRMPDKQHCIQNRHNLTVDYPKPSPHPLFELMGEEQAHVFWKDFVADEKIQAELLKQFPEVPLKGMENAYTEERLKCYVFERKTSQQKLNLTTKGLLLRQEQRISDKSAWDDLTLLDHAAESEYLEWLENLLKQHKNEIKKNPRACLEWPLGNASVNHKLANVSCFLDFIKQEGIPIDETRSFRLLHGVCQYNATGVFNLLLEDDKKIDLMIENEKGNTPLHVASAFGNHEMVELLLKTKKVEINHKNKEDHTALDLACAGNPNQFNPKVIQLLIENHALVNNVNRLLAYACEYGHAELVRQLLAYPKANVSSTQNHQNLFNIAVKHKKFEVVKVLLEQPNIEFKLFDPTYNIHVRNKLWGNLKSIYEKQHASGREAMYSEAQRRMQRAWSFEERLLLFAMFSVDLPLKGVSPLLPWWVAVLLRLWREESLWLGLPNCIAAIWVMWLQAQRDFSLLGIAMSMFIVPACSFGLGIMFPLAFSLTCGILSLLKGEPFESGVNLTVDLLLGPERIEKITLPEGKTFSDYQVWRRSVKRKLPKEASLDPDYEKVDELHYRKKQGYVKETQEKPDPFDYKEQHGQDVYLPSHKAGMLYLYTVQPNADEVQSDVFCAAKGNTPEFVKKLLK